MSTVNFSVPDDVRAAFDKAFAGQNKSGIIADLMRRAVHELEQRRRREQLFRQLSAGRARRPSATEHKLRAARKTGRP